MKRLVVGSRFIKDAGLQDSNCMKKGLQHIVSCEYWEIYENTNSEEHLQTAASGFLETVL